MKKILFSLALMIASAAHAQTFPDRNGLAVVDAANVIPDDQERALNNRIVAWNKSTGNEFVVATIPSLQGYDIKDYGYRLGRYWKLGKDTTASEKKGLVFLYAPNDKKARIEVGLGLEPIITDAISSEIIHDIVVPHAKQRDNVGAITGAVDALISAATPKAVDNPRTLVSPTTNKPMSDGSILFLVLAIIIASGCAGFLWVTFRKEKRDTEENKKDFDQMMRDLEESTNDSSARSYSDDYSPPFSGIDNIPKTREYSKSPKLDLRIPKGQDGVSARDSAVLSPRRPAPTPRPPRTERVTPPPPPPVRTYRRDDSDADGFGVGFAAGSILGSSFGSDDSSSSRYSSSDDSSSSPDTFSSGGSDDGFGGGGADSGWD